MWSHQYLRLVSALGIGSVLEWYEFGVYSQLDPYISKLFFPSSDPQLQQLGFWASYAVGFVARPFGGLVFGHLGDVKSRSLSLMIAIIGMALPTVLMGALPTYNMVGHAAPAILVALRLIQGLALGGEFGVAMVYFYETAPKGYQCLMGAISYSFPVVGLILGMCVVLIMEAATTDDQMLLWGWRVPYFLSLFTSVAGILLRRHMADPQAHSLRMKALRSGSLKTPPGLGRELSSRLSRSRKASEVGERGGGLRVPSHTATAAATAGLVAPYGSKNGLGSRADGGAAAAKIVQVEHEGSEEMQQQDGQMQQDQGVVPPPLKRVSAPLKEIIRQGYWVEMILHTGYMIWLAAAFWTFSTWAPSFLRLNLGLSNSASLGLVMAAMPANCLFNYISGRLGDKGYPRLALAGLSVLVGGAAVAPVFLGWDTHKLGVIFVLWVFMFCIIGFGQGFMCCSYAPLYPPEIRATAFNVPYTIANGVFGGLTPLAITALVKVPGLNPTYAPVLVLGVCAAVTLICIAVTWWLKPEANRTPPGGFTQTALPCSMPPQ